MKRPVLESSLKIWCPETEGNRQPRWADTGIFNAHIGIYLFYLSIGCEIGIHFSIHFLVEIDLKMAGFSGEK
jgi:hypothetical protein